MALHKRSNTLHVAVIVHAVGRLNSYYANYVMSENAVDFCIRALALRLHGSGRGASEGSKMEAHLLPIGTFRTHHSRDR